MKLNMGKPIAAGLILALIGISGCADNPITPAGENAESGRSESGAEHGDKAGGESHESSEGGAGRLAAVNEEGGQQLTLDQRYDQTRSGARLIMWYIPSRNAFFGTVENTTNQILCRVRVEVHLSDGSNAITAELGPTTPTNLAPGGQLLINLSAAGQTFDGWSPHVEVGSGEGGEGGKAVKAAVKAAGKARVMRPAAMTKAAKTAKATHRVRSSRSTSRGRASSTACA